jgi:catechol 2,3-dioxygenase-like lactoylglutathione lyase family enzyme
MTLRRAPTVAFLATSKPDEARTFFRDALGLRLTSEDDFAIVFATASGPLMSQKVETTSPQPFTALGWTVSDIRRLVRQLTRQGVQFARYPFLEQDQDAVWLAPSGTRVAWFTDPDGNILSLSQSPARTPRPRATRS